MRLEQSGLHNRFIFDKPLLSIGFLQDDQIREPRPCGDQIGDTSDHGHRTFNRPSQAFRRLSGGGCHRRFDRFGIRFRPFLRHLGQDRARADIAVAKLGAVNPKGQPIQMAILRHGKLGRGGKDPLGTFG